MAKIRVHDLLALQAEGLDQKTIARRMGVSPAAICQKLKRINQSANRPAILDTLTTKEERFVMEIAKGQNQTQAALQAFDVGSLDSAKTIGCRLMKDTDIQEAISAVMESEGLDKRYLVKKLKSHVDSVDPTTAIRALDMSFKVADLYPANKNLNLNVTFAADPVDLSKYRRG